MPDKKPEIAVIVPIYEKFIYARRAVLSLFKYTDCRAQAIVIDDASPSSGDVDWDLWYAGHKDKGEEAIPRDQCQHITHAENTGLTEVWNHGLRLARESGARYTVCTNSDVLFTPHWEEALTYQADLANYHLIGPTSNAPGFTNRGRQFINNFYPTYKIDDSRESLHAVAEQLRKDYPPDQIMGGPGLCINGFFMLARTETWWNGAFDENHVFDPVKRMSGNEDELQRRWHKRGYRSGFCPGSFIFHYRSVTRGSGFNTKGWHRLQDGSLPV